LRFPHHGQVLQERRAAAWFEVHPENYMADAEVCATLEAIRRDYPLSLHAVGLSPGSADGVDHIHLRRLATLADRLQPGLISDHLAWNTIDGRFLPDLLPLPYTEEALAVVCRNVDAIQNALGHRLLLENPSTYLHYTDAPIAEMDFLAAVVARSGCGVLLDVNNLCVSAHNRGVAPQLQLLACLEALPAAAIGEIHLAGHSLRQLEDGSELRIDDHGSAVAGEVWDLYAMVIAALGPRPTLIEWDTNIPALPVLQAQAARAQTIIDACAGDVRPTAEDEPHVRTG
jgi:uncharacterized protein (UPF0276 family)